MFIRKVTHINKRNAIEYHTYKLVESLRTQAGPRQKVILNLGTGFDLPEEEWEILSNRVEEIISGQETLFEYPEEIEILAKKYARKIIRRQNSYLPAIKKESTDYSPDYQTVDINSLENEESRTIGAEVVVYHTIKEIQLDQKLTELGFSKPQVDSAIGVIAGRLISPGSERWTHIWLQEISGIDEIMDTDFSLLSQDRVYKASDNLFSCKEEIEVYLSNKERSLFGLEEKIILYDLTNTFFEGSGKYNKKARFGKSKEKRSDCALVTLGLVLDGDGFPKRSDVFNGNIGEPTTLKEIIQKLSFGGSLIKPTIVLDAGIATEKNLEWIKGQEYTYIVVSRKKVGNIFLNTNPTIVKEDNQSLVRCSFVEDKEANDIKLIVHSTNKEKKEEAIKNLFQKRFEEELENIKSGLLKKNTTKRYEKVIEKIGRLKEKYKRVAHHYKITVIKDTETVNVKEIDWVLEKKETNDGTYLLRTNRTDISEKEIWDIYTMLTDIEDAFCCMKSELGLRPVHHQKENRVDGHLFITVLAYHILHTIRFKLRKKGINNDWSTIRTRLSTHTRITTTIKRKDGKLIHIRKSLKPELFHKEIYSALNLPYQFGKIIKTII